MLHRTPVLVLNRSPNSRSPPPGHDTHTSAALRSTIKHSNVLWSESHRAKPCPVAAISASPLLHLTLQAR
eukprot:jgi/Chrzof1/3862/Cz13g11160.t1